MWLEIAERSISCERCDREIVDGEVFMRFGVARSAQAQVFCADCFERMSTHLSQEFESFLMAGKIKPRQPVKERVEIKCFTCGLSPESCRCGREAYR